MATCTSTTTGLTNGLFRPKPQSGISGATVFARSYERWAPAVKSIDEFREGPGDSEVISTWFSATLKRITELLQLPSNWDGYGASEVRTEVARRALTSLLSLLDDDSPTPSVVPLSDGGLQVEWHRHSRSLEIEFPASGSASFYFYGGTSDEESEGLLPASNNEFRECLAQLA